MKLSEKLIARLRRDLPEIVPEGSTVERVRRGYWGISAGTWAWQLIGPNGYHKNVGSEDTMATCVKAKKLGWYRSLGGDIAICAE